MNLTKNFTLEELIYSDTAKQYGIDNTPDDTAIANLKALCENVLQPIRDKLGKPMNITSGYRCAALNSKVKGAANSQHLKGQAADFTVSGYTPVKLVLLIQDYGVEFDQLINEYNDWVHVSYNKGSNRNQPLAY